MVMAEGQYTSTVYSLIKECRFNEAIDCLEPILEVLPTNRAALSLLGHCYFHQGDFESASQVYETLVRHHGEFPEYRLHHAQALFRMGELVEASRVLEAVSGLTDQVDHLKLAISYALDQVQECKRQIRASESVSATGLQMEGCVLYKEGLYKCGHRTCRGHTPCSQKAPCVVLCDAECRRARQKFEQAAQTTISDPHLLYSIALCHFKENNASSALKVLAEVIEKAAQEHPELSVGSQGSSNVLSIGNTQTLQDSALIEAFNLKCAIELQLKNEDAAREALRNMPPRETKDLDPCTLHNKALVTMTDDPEEAFRTLNFLISNPPFPTEAFANLLFSYIKPPHNLYDFAADTMAQNPESVQRYLSREEQMFLDAVTMKESSAHGAYQQMEQLAKQHIEKLRLQLKLFQDARNTSNSQMLTQRMREYEDELERYIPVLMAQAHMLWDQGQYSNVLTVLQQSKEFVSENETWKLNLAHTFFMLDSPSGNCDDAGQSNFQRAIELYHPIYQHHLERKTLLKVSAMVLANLCVAFIMDEKNHEAEEIMKQVELEEEHSKRQSPVKQALHSCIINLVIGTLYCAKQNYDFGISRVMKSLQPLEQKLETDTWFYAKRCFLAIADGVCKHIIFLNDKTVSEILTFLDEAEVVGRDMPATISVIEKSRRSVGGEAQMLRKIIQKYYNS